MNFITQKDEKNLIPNSIDIPLVEAKELAVNEILTEQYFQLHQYITIY